MSKILNKKFKISVIVTSRADYGPMKILLKRFSDSNIFDVTAIFAVVDINSHFGNKLIDIENYKNIEYEFININLKVNSIIDHILKITKKISLKIKKIRPNLIIILGDRYELISVPPICLQYKIPLLHIAGGHVTEGSFDNSIRNMITKFAHLHVTSNKNCYKNVKKMGEEKWRIKNFGSLSVEGSYNFKPLNIKNLLQKLNLNSNLDFCLITLHPTTNKNDNLKKDIEILTNALNKIPLQIVITYPNLDPNYDIIIKNFNNFIQSTNQKNNKAIFVKNLGQQKYLTLMKHSKFIIGNSSSGIIESPSFNTPCVNIGDRQKGRIKASNIFDCDFNKNQIENSIKKAMMYNPKGSIYNVKNSYFMKNTSNNIEKFILNIFKRHSLEKILTKKLTYD